MMTRDWLQIRGDPSVRKFVFDQCRAISDFDRYMDAVLARTEHLICNHGVFHAKIHFSSSRVTLWLLDDPLRYRVHVSEEFLAPKFCLRFPEQPYTNQATVPREEVGRVLGELRYLRTLDNNIYLRSGSLNVVNGLVGINFSCDGSHYLDYRKFLDTARELLSQ